MASTDQLPVILRSMRLLHCPGKLKRAHLAAMIGVKSVSAFRPAANDAGLQPQPPLSPTMLIEQRLRLDHAKRVVRLRVM